MTNIVFILSYYFTKGTTTQVSIDKFFLDGLMLKNEISPPIISVGSTTILGNLEVGGVTKIHDRTDSIDTSSGSLIISGGLGVER